MSTEPRKFESTPAIRSRVPLIIALAGASGSGKTNSALELATGMQQVFGGDINVIDTEKGRALHYAEQYKFFHTPFNPPYSPGDYSDALAHVASTKPGVCIIDQLSYEHDGLGGVLEMHEAEMQRMAGDDWQKRERVKMAAWIRPKADRRRLINEIVQIGSAFAIIMCFRAKETTKPVKNTTTGKIDIEDQGFMPIAAPEFLFEATASCVLYPGSNGVPTWQTEFKGEKLFMKLPGQFKDILAPGKRLSIDMGRQLAEWAKGSPAKVPAASVPPITDLPTGWSEWSNEMRGENRATKGTAALTSWWLTLNVADKKALKTKLDNEWKPVAGKVDDAKQEGLPLA